ncbi:hypothetical protein MKW98_018871 [Papaver atlanticum]|uniref:Uncharacterized protein n=1 Tax=Papaver atlanticum TaxID=357466 RepID=A0AAD4TJ29_9MAGN|nr:hypothetical protein MKW98_018871 [Papaver atlanticum]
MEYLSFKRDEGIDLLKDKQGLQRLTETAEKAKMELSSLTQANISLPFVTAVADGPKLKVPVENSLRDAKLGFKDLDEVILVGGYTHIPSVQELVQSLTGILMKLLLLVLQFIESEAGVLYRDVERMVKEAERFAGEDKENKDAIDTKNQGDSLIYQTETTQGVGKKGKLGKLKEAVNGRSTKAIKDAMTALNQEVMKLGQSLYN